MKSTSSNEDDGLMRKTVMKSKISIIITVVESVNTDHFDDISINRCKGQFND